MECRLILFINPSLYMYQEVPPARQISIDRVKIIPSLLMMSNAEKKG